MIFSPENHSHEIAAFQNQVFPAQHGVFSGDGLERMQFPIRYIYSNEPLASLCSFELKLKIKINAFAKNTKGVENFLESRRL